MKLPFSVSARTAILIGAENFSNPIGAIIELVKNSYDADSNCCYILFDIQETGDSIIYIVDYGCGMNVETIKNSWMQIGTDEKQQNAITSFGRIKSGAKGIGRFAMNRLGKKSTLFTRNGDGDGLTWSIDWSDFNKPGKNVEDITAELDSVELSEIQKLTSDLGRKLNIDLPSFNNGTILKIEDPNDQWDSVLMDKLFESLEDLVPPFGSDYFKIVMFTNEKGKYGEVRKKEFDDYDYKLCAKYEDRKLIIKVTRNELDVKALKADYSKLFEMDEMKYEPYTLRNFEIGSFTKQLELKDLNLTNKNKVIDNEDKIGNFRFDFYFIKNSKSDIKSENSSNKYPYRTFSPTHRRGWLKKNIGIKMYRDNFRIRPYGDNGDDWLHLGERYAKNPIGAGQRKGGYHVRQNQVVGVVEISRFDSLYLQDKSGREGLQETYVFDLFKDILCGIINIMEVDRNTIMYNLSLLYENNNPRDIIKEKADKAQKTKEHTEENFLDVSTGYSTIKEELEETKEELRLLRNLASTGLVVTSFSHELRNFQIVFNNRAENLRKSIRRFANEKLVYESKIPKFQNPYELINDLEIKDNSIKSWLDFSINSVSKDKRNVEIINLNKYFTTFGQIWKGVLDGLNIEWKVTGFTDEMLIRAFAIDIDTIFNNIISNSIYAIKMKKSNDNRIISVEANMEEDVISISISDTGIGLSEQYKDNPNRVFDAFETSKMDVNGTKIGTGLGLYLVKTTLQEYEGTSVRVAVQEIGFKICVNLKAFRKDV